MRSTRRIRAVVLTAALAVVSSGCDGDGGPGPGGGSPPPTITVVVANTDCEVKDITINPFTVEQFNSGGANILRIKATVNCKGMPLNGATLTFTIPGATSPTTADSDANGNANPSNQTTPDNKNLIGQSVGVAVTGANGSSYPQGTATVTQAP